MKLSEVITRLKITKEELDRLEGLNTLEFYREIRPKLHADEQVAIAELCIKLSAIEGIKSLREQIER